jgi:RNA polymerase sigma factor (sigma-70 family)
MFNEGDKGALEALLVRREKWLWSVARKSIRDLSLAEEALQEALVLIWKNAHTFRGESQVSSWMYQIVSRACIDTLRKEQIRTHASLNEDEEIRCFLIKIEVWQIGDSQPAPRFEIMSVKNDWVASLKKTTASTGVSPLKIRQQQFWSEFCDYVRKKDPNMKLHKPGPQHWLNFSMGNSIAHLATTMNTQKNRFSTELYIADNKTLFSYLRDNEEEIKLQLGGEIHWFEANVAAGMNLYYPVDDVFNESRKEEYFGWLHSHLIQFKKIFTPYIQEFKSNASTD